MYVNAITYTGTILMEDCIVTNNTAQDGSAGGVFFGFADTEAVSGSVVLAGNYIADNVAAGTLPLPLHLAVPTRLVTAACYYCCGLQRTAAAWSCGARVVILG